MKIKYDSSQDFQLEAIEAITGLFEGQPQDATQLSVSLKSRAVYGAQANLFNEIGAIGNNLLLDNSALTENAKTIQEKNGIQPVEKLDGMNFSIEMETGTGKTYVYLRTALELAKQYNFAKFVILVPSIAIKEGVKSSLDGMREHFTKELGYDPYEATVYDGKSPEVVQSFATSTMTQFMVMTIDSIRGNRKLIVREARDKLNGIAPIEYLAAVNPIVIMDEPQNMETELSTSAISDLNPLCTLRYSATHIREYNMMYRLDPVEAHRRELVKGIVVANAQQKGSDAKPYIKLLEVRNTPQLEANLEILVKDVNSNIGRKPRWVKQHTDLAFVTKNDIYDGYVINDISTIPASVDIGTHGILMQSENWGGNEGQIHKEMIRETIKEHLKREHILRGEGIKVLSLIFVDRVASYLDYDDGGNQIDGKFAKWFDELYRQERSKSPYYQEITPENPSDVRTAYFAEMRKGGVTRLKESTGKSKEDESAYDLIMRSKEKLLDTNNPKRFIFSHSALREGWDNPNVFQICMMRESSNEKDRRQTIGRGLRLPVKQDGLRVHDSELNQLVVIANESYSEFANNLQKEYKKAGIQLGYVRKNEFARISLAENSGKTLGHTKSSEVWQHLNTKGFIDSDGKVLANFAPKNLGFTLDLPDEFKEYNSEIITIVESCKLDKFIKDARRREVISSNKEVLYSPLLEDLWRRISGKTTYHVSLDTEEVVKGSINMINKAPPILPLRIEVVKSRLTLQRGGFHNAGIVSESTNDLNDTFELPDIIKELQEATSLTRSTLVDILKGCDRLADFLKNPYDFMQMVRSSIKAVLHTALMDGIEYKKLHSRIYELRDFKRDSDVDVERFIDTIYEVKNKQKTITDRLSLDSGVEHEFAKYLDNREDVKLFLKLPAKFKIDTPVGPYNPDWAIVKEVDGQEKIYMVRETKGGGERESEKSKIEMAKLHFNAIGLNNYAKSTPDNWRV